MTIDRTQPLSAAMCAGAAADYEEELWIERARRGELTPEVPSFRRVRQWFHSSESALPETDRVRLASTLESSRALRTIFAMRQELAALWERSNESREQLLARLQDWCHRAEASGIVPLQNFSRRLRSYA